MYKTKWEPQIVEKLICGKDVRTEGIEHDKFCIGVYQRISQEERKLVGHVPIEISRLLYQFLEADEQNRLIAVPSGKRKREIGLVVPAKYTVITKNGQFGDILVKKLKDKTNVLEISVSDRVHSVLEL